MPLRKRLDKRWSHGPRHGRGHRFAPCTRASRIAPHGGSHRCKIAAQYEVRAMRAAVIPAGEIARAQFWRAGTHCSTHMVSPESWSRLSQEGSAGMTNVVRLRAIRPGAEPGLLTPYVSSRCGLRGLISNSNQKSNFLVPASDSNFLNSPNTRSRFSYTAVGFSQNVLSNFRLGNSCSNTF